MILRGLSRLFRRLLGDEVSGDIQSSFKRELVYLGRATGCKYHDYFYNKEKRFSAARDHE